MVRQVKKEEFTLLTEGLISSNSIFYKIKPNRSNKDLII